MKKLIIIIGIIFILTSCGENRNSIYSNTTNDYLNYTLTYGNSGAPKNCRAAIYENIKAYKEGRFSADDIIDSIDRNCGKDGHSWPTKN